jgi:hypothetical protein
MLENILHRTQQRADSTSPEAAQGCYQVLGKCCSGTVISCEYKVRGVFRKVFQSAPACGRRQLMTGFKTRQVVEPGPALAVSRSSRSGRLQMK